MKKYLNGFSAPIVITIVALLLLVVVGYLYLDTNTQSTLSISSNTGIVITSIKSDDLVKLPITIEGYIDGKDWFANEGEVGVAEVFDANGKSVSNAEIIKASTDWLKYPVYFTAVVGDRQMMSYIQTNTGVIKITGNGAKDGEQPKSISIPVRFK
jgi:hypothetical protein